MVELDPKAIHKARVAAVTGGRTVGQRPRAARAQIGAGDKGGALASWDFSYLILDLSYLGAGSLRVKQALSPLS